MITKEHLGHWANVHRAAVNILRNSDKYFEANKDLKWDDVFGTQPTAKDVQTIQELNRYPFVEIGHCWRCGENYKLTHLRLPPKS